MLPDQRNNKIQLHLMFFLTFSVMFQQNISKKSSSPVQSNFSCEHADKIFFLFAGTGPENLN